MHTPSLRTEIEIQPSEAKINLGDKVLTIGSCFSDSIGAKLLKNKFDVLSNPYGTTYNPISIFKILTSGGINYNKFVEHGGVTFHHDFHSELRADDQRKLEKLLQRRKEDVTQYLRSANWLIITFGTAWVYELVESGDVVNNCHKVPQKGFNRRLLGMKEMALAMDKTIEELKKINPDLNILMTVSPVRHTKDGLQENQLSKSMLRVLCDFAVTSHENVHYFPSYEIMVDDFRDYRFYKDDMIHPTNFAEQYIWDKFQSVYFSDDAMKFVHDWKYITSAMEHKPFNPTSREHQNFIKAQIDKLESLKGIVDVSEEEVWFKDKLV